LELQAREVWATVHAQHACGPIVVVDDDPQRCTVVVRLLEQAGYPVRVADAPEEALQSARQNRPRLVVLEVSLPNISGLELCRELRDELGPALPIMFLSSRGTDPLDRVAGLDVGADDYLAKPFVADEFLARVRALLRRSEPPGPQSESRLTPREFEVLWLLAEGLGQTEIAGRLVVTPKTVGNHIAHILRKLGVHSRAQAVAHAYREHLIAG
jgi:DNA-binding NarL/FixJ family response regulator